MLYDIKQLHSPNFQSRGDFKPLIIVDHITDGQDSVATSEEQEISAVHNTFLSAASQCSSHFEVNPDGTIEQYCRIEDDSWTQGLYAPAIAVAPSPIVRNMGVNPNYYSVSIEFIGFKDHGGDGAITEAQFWAGCWLHKWIQTEVFRIYGHKIPLNNTFVIGHCHIDPINRPFDPGPKFPWVRLFTELAIADNMTMQDYEGRLTYLGSDAAKTAKAYAIANELIYLWNLTLIDDGTGKWAKGILLRLHPIMTDLKLMTKPYSEDASVSDVYNQILYLYNTGQQKDGDGIWAKTQLLTLYPYMLSNGLVPS